MANESLRQLLPETSVNLTTSPAVCFGPMDLQQYDSLNVMVRNPDASLEIDGSVEVSNDGLNWDATEWDGLVDILALETRNESFSKPLQKFIQIKLVASGTLNGAKIEVWGVQVHR